MYSYHHEAKFGMTPEKIAEVRDTISRDAAESNVPLKSLLDKKFTSSNSPECEGSDSIAAASKVTPIVPPGCGVDYRSALTRFFESNAPEKIEHVDSYLQKYQVRQMRR
jgi:hypothetical protein